jgi:hypothetical protein
VYKKRKEKHPQTAEAETSLRASAKTDYERHIAYMPDEDKPLLRTYEGKTNLQRGRTIYYQHLYEWFNKKYPLKKDTPQEKGIRTFKELMFEDPDYPIELGPATNFKGAGELLETARELAL